MCRLSALLLLVPTLCLGSSTAVFAHTITPGASQPDDSVWMSVRLGGRQIGHLRLQRDEVGNIVTTTQILSLELDRAGKRIQLGNTTRSVENADGQPLGFLQNGQLSAMASTVEAQRQADGQFRVVTTVGGESHTKLIDWPQGALLGEGQRLAMLAAGRHPGTRYVLHEFDPASQQMVTVNMQVLGDEQVVLPDGKVMTLSHQRQLLHLTTGDQIMDLWLDSDGIPRKGRLNLIGQPLEMLACSRACALAPIQSVDMLRAAMVSSPRELPAYMRVMPLRYLVHVSGHSTLPFIDTGEQHVTALSRGYWLIDMESTRNSDELPPLPADREPNAWLQSDAPAIRQLAARAVGRARNDRDKMRRLRSFVSGYITQHGLDVGYASALEVVKNRQGDCTEYAVLLAAMARAEGIPARVVTGMVYADRYAGVSRVFAPHAWMQAWVDGRWQSYDAALRQFDYTHLALAVGDGDPWRFFAGTQLFGEIRIDRVVPHDEMPDTAPVDAAAAAPAAGNAASR